jgi:4-hydroxybenzoate polyprenyltransferase
MSTGTLAAGQPPVWLGFDGSQLVIAGGIGMYVVGLTYFARHEAQPGDRLLLGRGAVLMTVGLVLLGLFPRTGAFASGDVDLTLRPAAMWPLLVALLGFSVLRRCVIAIRQPTAKQIQIAVKQCLVSLIVFDAAICLATVRPAYWSVLILALMFPMLVLGRWVYST